MISPKPAVVRFYFDADVLGLAKLVCSERADATYPGDPGGRIKKRLRPPCPVTKPGPNVFDDEWIPVVAEHGWLIITRDRRIQDKVAEIDAVRNYEAKMVNLASDDAFNTWTQLEVLMIHWRDIEPLSERAGPFIYTASRTRGLRELDLDSIKGGRR